jgi:S-adenosylmethionine:tRNA ribosyltransferase-isomerase
MSTDEYRDRPEFGRDLHDGQHDQRAYESPRPPSGLRMDDFDYALPAESIAQHPIEPRDAARLLVSSQPGLSEHRHVRDLPTILRAGDLLVVNETRVIPARLHLRKSTGGAVEVFLLERSVLGDWLALVKPGRKVPTGTRLSPGPGLIVEIGSAIDGGQRRVRLLGDDGEALEPNDEERALEHYGAPPLPPYITERLDDPNRYQTTYARVAGSAAAPTAGLHLTSQLLDDLRSVGVGIAKVDLRVGLDTFRPVTAERPEDHDIHSERFDVPDATWDAVMATKASGGRVIAVGTTTVRSLETAAASGARRGRTKLLIYGEYPFAVVDLLLTNFHLPRSSLLLLVEAFAGPRWRNLYSEAIISGYRFLSFGDAMLLSRRPPLS